MKGLILVYLLTYGGAVVGLALIVGLIVVVLFVMQQLRHASAIQDCVASGRTNCAPISSGR